jgi:hypothetical protein
MTDEQNRLTIPLNAAPFEEMIASMGAGIAEAQRKLDTISFEIAKLMSGADEKYRLKLGANERSYSLLELGFTPTFYQFVDTTLEIKVAITMSADKSTTPGASAQGVIRTKGTPVDATYANRFQYPVEGSSVLRTKLVTVPPPGLLESRVREMIQTEQQKLTASSGQTKA